MEWLSLILNFILGSGLLGTLVFYVPKRRKEIAEAKSAELENMSKEGNVYEARVQFLLNQIDFTQSQVDEYIKQFDELQKKLVSIREHATNLEIDLVHEKMKSDHYHKHTCKVDDCKLRVLIDKIDQ